MRENVIVYCRVSSDEQTLGSSLQVQEERICRYCEANGYNIIKEIGRASCRERV